MMRESNCAPNEPPEAGVGGEGPITDQTVLAPETDQELEQAIRDAFFLDPNLPVQPFSIRVENRVAYIGGKVEDPNLRQRALDVASGVQRINRVISTFDQSQRIWSSAGSP